jgi:hypothetical protein
MRVVIFIFLAAVLFQYKVSFSQSMSGTATMNANWVIHLDGSAVLTEYNTDVTAVGFKSEEQARKFFNGFRDNLFEFRDFDLNTKKVKVIIHPEYLRNPWTVAQWNEYFTNKAADKKSRFPSLP